MDRGGSAPLPLSPAQDSCLLLSQPLVPGGPLCQEELSWALTQGPMVQCSEGSYRLGTVLYIISF